jgi:hypothetical protein
MVTGTTNIDQLDQAAAVAQETDAAASSRTRHGMWRPTVLLVLGAGLLVKFVHGRWLWQRDRGPYEVDHLAKRLGPTHGEAGHETCLGRVGREYDESADSGFGRGERHR